MSTVRSLTWRPMLTADLPRVLALADQLHPNYPERLEIFADKLAFDPEGCRVALDGASTIIGYAVAHLWTAGLPPLLDTPLGAPPAQADCLHLHDIALLPIMRGLGASRQFLTYLEVLALRRHLSSLTLVAIKGQDSYWAAHGFSPVQDNAALQTRLDSYGTGNTYMVKSIA